MRRGCGRVASAFHSSLYFGVAAMIGRRALVVKDIAPEGKVEVWGEIWTATGGNERISAGKEVKILDAKGLVLAVDVLDEDRGG